MESEGGISWLNLFCTIRSLIQKQQKNSVSGRKEGDYDTLTAQLMTEAEAKQILMRYNYEKYAELYGELEEG